MLLSLRIKNLALVTDLTLDFQPGYNVITGETGAGKSMLIGALNLVLGQRADRSLLRSGSDSCSVEAVFDVTSLGQPFAAVLEEKGLEPCEENLLVLKRSLTAAGANRQFVNGSPASLAVLESIGEWLVDIHGPHEHQSLLHPFRQLEILDAYGKLEGDRQRFATTVRRLDELNAAKAALIVDEKTYAQQLDLLRFQVNEIAAARLNAEAEAQAEQDYRRASNATKLLQLAQTALDGLGESDNSVLTQAGAIGRALQELQRADTSAAPLAELHSQAVALLHELQGELAQYADQIDLDPSRLQELEDRLNLVQALKRKYGATIEEVIAFGDEARAKLTSLEQRDAELERLNAEWKKLHEEMWRVGLALSAKRRGLLSQLGKAISTQLADLGFKQSRFTVEIVTAQRTESTAVKPTAQGLDTVEFHFAPNAGEPAKPLRAIASSGELARVMLAVKTVLAVEDKVPVLVFDEVDANVGGETARTVGEKMKQIARRRQVLCITHLPQVAAPASAHFVVTKTVKEGRTVSQVSLLERTERIQELARMLGGQSDAARRHAEELVRHVD